MTDLVKRLRDYGDREDYEVHEDRIEAADRIEQLEAALRLIIANEDSDTGYGNSSAKIARTALKETTDDRD